MHVPGGSGGDQNRRWWCRVLETGLLLITSGAVGLTYLALLLKLVVELNYQIYFNSTRAKCRFHHEPSRIFCDALSSTLV